VLIFIHSPPPTPTPPPGIMPIMTYGGFKRMTGFCKTYVPPRVADALEAIKDNEEAVKVGARPPPPGAQTPSPLCPPTC